MTTPWRDHPKLRGRFATGHPDDLQVIVHDGGPRITDRAPELVWVTVTGCDGTAFSGRLINQPEQLTTVAEGDEIRFVVPDSGEHALMVTEKYLQERPDWIIQPCPKCGLSELFDAPSDLMRVVFPDTPPDAIMEVFTASCGACGGVQVVQYKDAEVEDEHGVEPTGKPEKWWQFWR